MIKDKNETVEISTRTAWIALECLHDWLEYVDCLDDETRRKIAALDELVRALDAEAFITDKRDKERARAEAAWKSRQAEEEAKKKKAAK
jgi:hypothetical protein